MRSLLTLLIISVIQAGIAQSAKLQVDSEPIGAMVFLDGRYVGLTPLTIDGVALGKHLLKLIKHGYKPWVNAIDVGEEENKVSVRLSQYKPSSISITSVPTGVSVYLDNVLKGKTPIVLTDIEPGRHTIRLEHEDFIPYQSEVNLKEGEQLNIDARLESKNELYLIGEINANPENVRAYYELAHFYMIRGRYDDALKTLQAGIDACTSPTAITSDMRRMYQEIERIYTGQFKFGDENTLREIRPKILQLLEEGIKRTPRNHYNYVLLAELLDSDEKALELYEMALKAMRTERARSYFEVLASSALYKLATKALKGNELTRAIALFEEAVRKYPKAYASRDALLELANVYANRLKDARKAIETWERFIQLYPDDDRCPTVRLNIADAYANSLSDYERAIAEYRRYLKDYPERDDCPSVHMKLAQVYHQALKDLKGALKEYEAILQLYPDWDGLAGVLKAIGDILLQMGEKEKAEEKYAELVKRFPRSLEAIYVDKDPERRKYRQAAARAYSEAYKLEQRNAVEAVERYKAVATEFKDSYYAPISLLRAAYICQYVLKDSKTAIALREKFLQLFPDDDRCEEVLLQIASTYASMKQYEEAAQKYEEFIKRYPKSDRCVYAQANIIDLYRIWGGNYDRKKHIEESLKLMRNYPHYDGIPTIWFYLALNYYYQAYPGDKEKAQQELLKLVQTYPYSSIRKSAEYYLDLIDAGLQSEENKAR
jgi:tetratricopeptide (TPR) repeat protein